MIANLSGLMDEVISDFKVSDWLILVSGWNVLKVRADR
jgi:hypothetical protein